MAKYYVSTSGSDSADGSEGSPFASISHAVNAGLQPGDEVIVKPGTYNESVYVGANGSAAGDITIRSEVPGEAEVIPPSGGSNGFTIEGNYITVDGFNVHGSDSHGIVAQNNHHVTISNNISHDNGASGVAGAWGDFYTIEGNTTYDNASSGWYSGISLYQNRNITGDNSTDGFRNIIRNNTSYDNVTENGTHTDGNGIIIDDFQSTQTDGFPNYTFETLVENNLVYQNGGKGVQVTWSDGVTVRGNTAYHNNQDLQNTGTWRGEISNAQSSDNTYVNNIAVADPSVNSDNTALDNTSYGGYSNDNVVWENNLTYDGTGQASVRTDGGNAMPTEADGNLLGVAPQFVDASGGDFSLTEGSPAIDAGTNGFGLANVDLEGTDRTVGTVDMGALEQGSGGGSGGDNTGGGGGGTGTGTGGGSTGTGGTDTGTGTDTGGTDTDTGTDTGGSGGSGDSETDTGSAGDGGSGDAGNDGSSPEDFSLWGDGAEPGSIESGDTASVELGMQFQADVASEASAIRVYKAAGSDLGTVTLWDAEGNAMATADASGLGGSGWKEVAFDAPVQLEAGQTYTASYHAEGGYAVDEGYFDGAEDAGPLSTGANAGVYAYGDSSSAPTQSYNQSNYWVDVVLNGSDGSGEADAGSTGGDQTGGQQSGSIGETGTVQTGQANGGEWHHVSFANALDNPAVVMGGGTNEGGNPYTVDVQNVTSQGFDFQIDEWNYLDGFHVEESLSWMAVESGTHQLADGRTISAGSTQVGDEWTKLDFGEGAFDSKPVVFAQASGEANGGAATDRLSRINEERAFARLVNEEGSNRNVQDESVDWIAVESGGGADSGDLVGSTGVEVDHKGSTIDFGGSFGSDDFAFLTNMQTTKGTNPAMVEAMSISNEEAQVQVREETSQDNETWHVAEDVGFAAFETGVLQGSTMDDMGVA